MTDRQSIVGELDTLCDAFENEWNSGREPSILEYLDRWTESVQRPVLRELLFLDVYYRRKHDQSPEPDDYHRQFPEDVVTAAFELLERSGETVEGRFEIAGDGSQQSTIVYASDSAARQTPTSPIDEDRFGDYELLHEIARGGMGVVYKARQSKLDRVVALKMIKSGELAGEDEIQRFHAEAEAAAKLDHPNIVPIYEVGEQNGQHFFSMGFVDGEGLDARLKQGPLESREAAGLIQTIAEGVQYAHEKGIVHRDLKPANVLLAGDGTPRITDFGLAKNIAADSGMTATGQVLGTPSYMPPEQAAGNSEEIGPLADVYALGALLYGLLTGRPPFQAANVMETLKQVLHSEPVAPRSLNPAIDRDLETICLKCLEKEPHNRYASARDLADELERFLQHKPILARPVGRIERSRRWCKRNPLGAVIAGLVLFLAVAGPTVAAYQIETNHKLDTALTSEKDARETAQQKEQETAAALKRKDEALRETEQAIAGYVKTAKNSQLLQEPRFKPLLIELLSDALKYYEGFIDAHEHEQDEPTRVRLAKALFEVAWIHTHAGAKDKSIAAYRRAIAIFAPLVREKPQMMEYRFALSGCHLNMGLMLSKMGRRKEALQAYRLSIQTLEALIRDRPAVSGYRLALATCQHNAGLVYDSLAEWDDAERAYRNAIESLNSIPPVDRRGGGFGREFVRVHLSLSDLYRKMRKLPAALAMSQRALKTAEQIAAEQPSVVEYQRALARCHHQNGIVLVSSGKLPEGNASDQKALKVRERLARENPTVDEIQYELYGTLTNLGLYQERVGDRAGALQYFKRSLQICDRLVRENPSVAEYRFALATTHEVRARCHEADGQRTLALQSLKQALAIHERLAVGNRQVVKYQARLAVCLNSLGLHYYKSKQADDAMKQFRRCLAIRERLARGHLRVPKYRIDLAGGYVNLANLLRRTQPQAALQWHGRAIPILKGVLQTDPHIQLARFYLRNAYANRGLVFEDMADYRSAANDHRLAFQLELNEWKLDDATRLMRSLAADGQYAEAEKTAMVLQGMLERPEGKLKVTSLYDLACAYGLTAAYTSRDRGLSDSERNRRAATARRRAMEILAALAKFGTFKTQQGRETLRIDRRLNALRHLRGFRTFARSIGLRLPAWASRPLSSAPAPSGKPEPPARRKSN